MSYKNLEIWQEAKELSIKIHEMTFKLPKFEQFEEAQQIRGSIKSVRSNTVEGYGRRAYKQEYLRFLIMAQASNDETIDHLEMLIETKSLMDLDLYNDLHGRLEILGKKINSFIKAAQRQHNSFPSVSEPVINYPESPETSI